MDKFQDLPEDKDTVILFQKRGIVSDFQVLFQHWSYDGILGISAIFLKEDVGGYSDDELKDFIDKGFSRDEITISRHSEKYIFVNYGFKVND
ncbi:MAG: hypothetical protein WCY16_00710 [Weeksellaceae bacterium]